MTDNVNKYLDISFTLALYKIYKGNVEVKKWRGETFHMFISSLKVRLEIYLGNRMNADRGSGYLFIVMGKVVVDNCESYGFSEEEVTELFIKYLESDSWVELTPIIIDLDESFGV